MSIERIELRKKYYDGNMVREAVMSVTDDYNTIMKLLKAFSDQPPLTDVIEVVRCEDCRYWDRETIRQNSNDAGWWNEAVCLNFEKREKGWDDFDRYTDADWFCADGERREDNGC